MGKLWLLGRFIRGCDWRGRFRVEDGEEVNWRVVGKLEACIHLAFSDSHSISRSTNTDD